MQDVFIIGIIMSVPVTAIISGTIIKLRKMELEKQKTLAPPEVDKLVDMAQRLAKENQDLKQRVENLETIVSLSDSHLAQQGLGGSTAESLPPFTHKDQPQAKLTGEIAQIVAERRKPL